MGRLVGGIALCVIALILLVGGLGIGVAATWMASRSPVAESEAPGSVTFDASHGAYVVALGTAEESWNKWEMSGSERREKFRVRDGDVIAARCTINHPKGEDEKVRGDRQVSSITFGSGYASIGTFDGRNGETTIECVFDPPTEARLSDGKTLGKRDVPRRAPFMVHESEGLLGTLGWVLLGVGLSCAALGTVQILRATVWRKPS
jgi:hypothetical protein